MCHFVVNLEVEILARIAYNHIMLEFLYTIFFGNLNVILPQG